jgi:hypothetical protein
MDRLLVLSLSFCQGYGRLRGILKRWFLEFTTFKREREILKRQFQPTLSVKGSVVTSANSKNVVLQKSIKFKWPAIYTLAKLW